MYAHMTNIRLGRDSNPAGFPQPQRMGHRGRQVDLEINKKEKQRKISHDSVNSMILSSDLF